MKNEEFNIRIYMKLLWERWIADCKLDQNSNFLNMIDGVF